MKAAVERRRFRRTELEVPVSIQAAGGQQGEVTGPIVAHTKDISLAGMYCHVQTPCSLVPGQSVVCSMTIPEEQTQHFPFTRISGKGSVVRVEPIVPGRRAGESQTDEELVGMAVAFAPDVTALGTIEWY